MNPGLFRGIISGLKWVAAFLITERVTDTIDGSVDDSLPQDFQRGVGRFAWITRLGLIALGAGIFYLILKGFKKI